jgi:hypothetical protein
MDSPVEPIRKVGELREVAAKPADLQPEARRAAVCLQAAVCLRAVAVNQE